MILFFSKVISLKLMISTHKQHNKRKNIINRRNNRAKQIHSNQNSLIPSKTKIQIELLIINQKRKQVENRVNISEID